MMIQLRNRKNIGHQEPKALKTLTILDTRNAGKYEKGFGV